MGHACWKGALIVHGLWKYALMRIQNTNGPLSVERGFNVYTNTNSPCSVEKGLNWYTKYEWAMLLEKGLNGYTKYE